MAQVAVQFSSLAVQCFQSLGSHPSHSFTTSCLHRRNADEHFCTHLAWVEVTLFLGVLRFGFAWALGQKPRPFCCRAARVAGAGSLSTNMPERRENFSKAARLPLPHMPSTAPAKHPMRLSSRCISNANWASESAGTAVGVGAVVTGPQSAQLISSGRTMLAPAGLRLPSIE